MARHLLRRLGYGLLILVGVNLLTFFLFFTVNTPDDMARLNIGGKRVTQEQIDKWKRERGYDRPLYWNGAEQGAAKLTRTVLWERSVSLMLLDFGRSDSARSTDIGHEVATRMGVSLQLAVPIFVLQLIVSVAFSLLLVFFRHSAIDFWGVVLCVVMLSISSLFYIIVGQFLFSRVLHLVPVSGFASGAGRVALPGAAGAAVAAVATGRRGPGCTAHCSSRRWARTTCARRVPRASPSRRCCCATCCATH